MTNAQPGQSLHNYYPALAFDVAFKVGATLHWEVELFRDFAAAAKGFGLAWGGDWKSFNDNPHFEPPDFTWRRAWSRRFRI
ncbi:MAG: M15 family metallopeptidase [Betaproteobacteria bacterium]|nr:M15 family metallopeptidase [Betaproteobacteria bacterium]